MKTRRPVFASISTRLALAIAVPAVLGCGSSAGGKPPDAPCAGDADLAGLRLNQVQVVGSHNSYRRHTYQPLFEFVQGLSGMLPEDADPAAWDYDHVPLAEQLGTWRMRGVEIDLYNDPDGGRYYNRMGLKFIAEPVESNIPELMTPGLKVLHVPDFDYETHHYTFRSALEALLAWSDAHPTHLPLFVHLETKEFTVADVLAMPELGLTKAVPFDATAADLIDGEIRAVFTDAQRIITPDEVRGAHATVEEAVLAGEWPALEACRGRFVFFLEGAAIEAYVAASPAGSPALAGRLVFPVATPGQPHAAFVLQNGPVGNEAVIADLVQRGYIVRTMGDANTVEARTGDRTRAEAGLTSGAQIVSTDYYRPDPRGKTPGSGWTTYELQLPGGGPARTNPVNGGGAGVRRICD